VVAAVDLTGAGTDQVVVGPDAGSPVVHLYNPQTGQNLANFIAGPTTNSGGTRLGVVRGGGGSPDELLVGNGPGDTVGVEGLTGTTGALSPLPPTDAARAYGVYVG
jgi:hypothetical protein